MQDEIILRNDAMDCVVIFTHGFALRAIVKHSLGINDEDFRFLQNPPNCYLAKIHARSNVFVLDKLLPVVSL